MIIYIYNDVYIYIYHISSKCVNPQEDSEEIRLSLSWCLRTTGSYSITNGSPNHPKNLRNIHESTISVPDKFEIPRKPNKSSTHPINIHHKTSFSPGFFSRFFFLFFPGHRMVRPNGRDEESPELERLLALGKTFQKPRLMWTDFPWRNH